MISKLVATACAVGMAGAVAVAGPAAAASAPTLSGPADRTGFGPVTLSGTAAPGAVVSLYETAIIFDDLELADDWEHGGGPLTATADSSGHWRIVRQLDSGFYFQVESGGLRSAKITVRIRVLPMLTLSSSQQGTVHANVVASPAQPGLPVQLQQARSGGTWSTVATGVTGESGAYAGTVSGVGGGTQTFRAYIGADPSNGVIANYSAAQKVTVGGPAGSDPAPKPAPKPSPNPTPAVGSVQFTKIQYNPPGTDTSSNAGLNREWARLTNKTSKTINLKGWTVRDAAGNTYTFTATFNLGGGRSIYVYTGKGTSGSVNRYWGRRLYVWNNGGDTATLRTAAGKTIDTCKWGAGSGVTSC